MNANVTLRDPTEDDLLIFYQQQLDPIANQMAAFPPKQEDFDAFKAGICKALVKKTILFGGMTAGYVLSFVMHGETTVAYWIGREYWGQGIATEALKAFLHIVKDRPLYARAAKDNNGSVRVLEKNGFRIIGEDKGFAHARGHEVEEYIFQLN